MTKMTTTLPNSFCRAEHVRCDGRVRLDTRETAHQGCQARNPEGPGEIPGSRSPEPAGCAALKAAHRVCACGGNARVLRGLRGVRGACGGGVSSCTPCACV